LRFSELMRRTQPERPQDVTVRREPNDVGPNKADYGRLRGSKPSFTAFLSASPLVGLDLKFERNASSYDDVAL